MLILARRKAQTICIYPEDKLNDPAHLIEIHVLDIDRGQVRMGIDAPSGIAVHRKKIYERILLQHGLRGDQL